MKIIYLLPPSEGKNLWWKLWDEKLAFYFKKPLEIARCATEKDLKCIWKRYEQGIGLNNAIENSEKLEALLRYSWVMYTAINYIWMTEQWKKYFENNFKILSGMYGVVEPLDMIGNYKLPIETKWLYKFWWDQISKYLYNQKADYIIDLLPWSYAKMIDWKSINSQIIKMNFLHQKDGELKKITHGVKKIKGEYIYNLCEKNISKIEDLEGQKVQISEKEYHINIIL
jgi:cytoplasmic iron level regulating protein YaaA (DUF328/UPF0246 family)